VGILGFAALLACSSGNLGLIMNYF
jgi:hypothetical protein